MLIRGTRDARSFIARPAVLYIVSGKYSCFTQMQITWTYTYLGTESKQLTDLPTNQITINKLALTNLTSLFIFYFSS